MTVALIVAVLVMAALCLWLVRELRALQAEAAELGERVAALRPAPPVAPDLEAALDAGGRPLIVVDVLNPLELAMSRTRAAGVVATMAPSRLHRIVLEQAVKQMYTQFEDEGVKAQVTIRAGR